MDAILNLDNDMDYLFVESAEVSVEKAILAMDTYQRLSELNERARALRQYSDTNKDLFCEAGENPNSGKNLLIRVWEAIKKFAQKLWSMIRKRNSGTTLAPDDVVVVKKPFATAVKTIKGLWARVKSAATNIKSDLSRDGNWKKLLAVIAAATVIGGAAVVFVKRKKKKNNQVANRMPTKDAEVKSVTTPEVESATVPPDCVEVSGKEIIQAQAAVEEIVKAAEVHASKEVEAIKKSYDKDMVDDLYSKMRDTGSRYEHIAEKETKKTIKYRDGLDDLGPYNNANHVVVLWNTLLGHIKDFNKQLDSIMHLPTDEKAQEMQSMRKLATNIESDARGIRQVKKSLIGGGISNPEYFGSTNSGSGMSAVIDLLRDFK